MSRDYENTCDKCHTANARSLEVVTSWSTLFQCTKCGYCFVRVTLDIPLKTNGVKEYHWKVAINEINELLNNKELKLQKRLKND